MDNKIHPLTNCLADRQIGQIRRNNFMRAGGGQLDALAIHQTQCIALIGQLPKGCPDPPRRASEKNTFHVNPVLVIEDG
jgi:hypothetical protein